jgi:hypothetical protein
MEGGNKVPITETLYRRSHNSPEKKFLNPDGSATSRVFKLRPKDEGKLSTNVKSLTTYGESIIDPEKYLLFEILVQKVIDINLHVIYEPVEGNIAHSYIFGMSDDDDISPGLLARKSKIVRI